MYGQLLAQAFVQAAKDDGLPVTTVTVQMPDDKELREFLENMKRFEEESRKADIVFNGVTE